MMSCRGSSVSGSMLLVEMINTNSYRFIYKKEAKCFLCLTWTQYILLFEEQKPQIWFSRIISNHNNCNSSGALLSVSKFKLSLY